jgi:hypothetical protein
VVACIDAAPILGKTRRHDVDAYPATGTLWYPGAGRGWTQGPPMWLSGSARTAMWHDHGVVPAVGEVLRQ